MEIIKSVLVLLVVSTLAVSIVGATSGGIDAECQDFGFDSGIAKWEWENGWYPEGDDMGTWVSGTDTYAEWNVGTSNATGIVVKGGSPNSPQNYIHYAVWGTSGIVEEDSPATSHITFCYDENEIPEFGTIGAAVALLGGILVFYLARKK